MAAQLAAIHRLTPLRHDLSFLPDQATIVTKRLQEGSADEPGWFPAARLRASLLAAWPFRHSDPPTLLHGDFWSGNLLWRAGQLVAVIDWEDAKVGDPLADLAKARLELLWFHGEVAMRRFTESYLELTGRDRDNLAIWDLYVAWWSGSRLSGWGLAPDAERSMRAGLNRFIELAEAARRDH
jgi:aminoglycoside phosphotransferase (APT) family kinase protein